MSFQSDEDSTGRVPGVTGTRGPRVEGYQSGTPGSGAPSSGFPQLPSSAAHCLDLTAGFRHRNAFDEATSSTVPAVPGPHPGCLELILVSSGEVP